MAKRQAIVLISFGAKEAAVRSGYIDSLTNLVSEKFTDYSVFHVFTSKFIVNNLRQCNEEIFFLADILEKLVQAKYDTVLLQPTHISDGSEYREKIVKVAKSYQGRFLQLIIGKPAITEEADELAVLAILARQAGSVACGEEIVCMGHGSPHEHNPLYEKLQVRADNNYNNITIGVLEEADYPNLAMVIERLRNKNCHSVYLQPLLFTAGLHVIRDMAGDSSHSWRSRLTASGFKVRIHTEGLGINPGFQALYLQKLQLMQASLGEN